MKQYPTLYKLDSKGKLREWRMEVDGARYRTVSGLQHGQQVTSEWKTTVARNVGKSNGTSAQEQAHAEVQALYARRLEGEYHAEISGVNQARFYKPMLADKWEDRRHKVVYPVWVQPKLDGVRAIATRDGLFSRTGKAIVAVPHIMDQLAPLFDQYPDAVLDGELYNHDLKHDFNQIISLVRKTKPSAQDLTMSAQQVEYHVYDFPSADHNFSDRSQALAALLGEYTMTKVLLVETQQCQNQDQVDQAYGEYLEAGYEGGIIRLDGPYEQKRSKYLLKRKDFQDAEFTIVSIEEGQGNWSGCAKKVIFQLDPERTATATLTGTQEYCAQVLAERHKYSGGEVTVQYFQLTPDGVPRFPIAKAIYPHGRHM